MRVQLGDGSFVAVLQSLHHSDRFGLQTHTLLPALLRTLNARPWGREHSERAWRRAAGDGVIAVPRYAYVAVAIIRSGFP